VICGLSVATLIVRAGNNDHVLTDAAKAFAHERSYGTRFSVETKMPSSFGVQMTGSVDQHTQVGRFVMRFTYAGTKRTVTCGMLTSAQNVYIPVKKKDRPRFANKPWVESSVAGLLPIQGFGTKGFDPSTFANIHDLKKTGTDSVRGIPTTVYTGTLHIDRSKLTNTDPAVMNAVPSEAPVEVWVSSDHLIRKLQDTVTSHAGSLSYQTTSTFEFYDFGVPVDIAAPPSSEIDHGNARSAIAACLS
jgi:LppX/LprAFG-like lipoprotein